jgi:hypothetical protein
VRQWDLRNSRWLVAGYVWALIWAVVGFVVPVVRSNITYQNRFGNYVARGNLTLFQEDHAIIFLGGGLIVLVLATATAELSWRVKTGRTNQGPVTTVVAAWVILFSLFGLIFGLLSVGAVGGCALFSAMPLKGVKRNDEWRPEELV